MDSKTLDTLTKLDAPLPLIERLSTRDEQIAAVRAAQYRPEKEQAEIARIREAHAFAEADALRSELEAIEAEQGRALAQLDAEIAKAHALPTDPTAIASLGVEESRRARLASLAAMDAALLGQSDDLARITATAISALEQDAESGLRVAAAAEARLFALAKQAMSEARDDNRASVALAQVRAAVAPIEQRARDASPRARREAITTAAERRKMAITSRVHNASQLGGFRHAIDPFMRGLVTGGGR